jgi:microcystin-dependent protein
MFYPGQIIPPKTLADVIPKGYALCDGELHGGIRTPDLRGRFIRGAENENDIGVHDNSSLLTGDSGRKDSIKIKADNLPPHQHTFKLESATFTHTLKADRFEGSRSDTYNSAYSCSGGSVKEGEGSGVNISGVCNDSTASVSIDISHEHTISGDITL